MKPVTNCRNPRRSSALRASTCKLFNWKEAKEWGRLAAAISVVLKDEDGERQARYIEGAACCADGDIACGLRSFE